MKECRAKDPHACRYHGALLRMDLALEKGDINSYLVARQEAESFSSEDERKFFRRKPSSYNEYVAGRVSKIHELDSSLAKRIYPHVTDYKSQPADQIAKNNRWGKVSKQYFKEGLTFTVPLWDHATSQSFQVYKIDDSNEVFLRSFSFYLEEYDESGYKKSPSMTEAFLVRDGKPAAYYSFITSEDEDKEGPPIIYTAEVREEYRGNKLGSYFKNEINKILKVELHSNGVFTDLGYRSLDKSPVWEQAPQGRNDAILGEKSKEGYIIVTADSSNMYIDNWDALSSHSWADDW